MPAATRSVRNRPRRHRRFKIDNLMLSTFTVQIKEVALYTDGVTSFARDASAGEKKLCEAISMLVGNAAIAQPA